MRIAGFLRKPLPEKAFLWYL